MAEQLNNGMGTIHPLHPKAAEAEQPELPADPAPASDPALHEIAKETVAAQKAQEQAKVVNLTDEINATIGDVINTIQQNFKADGVLSIHGPADAAGVLSFQHYKLIEYGSRFANVPDIETMGLFIDQLQQMTAFGMVAAAALRRQRNQMKDRQVETK